MVGGLRTSYQFSQYTTIQQLIQYNTTINTIQYNNQYNTVQHYCYVTKAQAMYHGIEHTHEHIHSRQS